MSHENIASVRASSIALIGVTRGIPQVSKFRHKNSQEDR